MRRRLAGADIGETVDDVTNLLGPLLRKSPWAAPFTMPTFKTPTLGLLVGLLMLAVGGTAMANDLYDTIDGLRADWPDGWGLLRASNTTPALVLRFDAKDEAVLARIKATFRVQLLAIAPTLRLPF